MEIRYTAKFEGLKIPHDLVVLKQGGKKIGFVTSDKNFPQFKRAELKIEFINQKGEEKPSQSKGKEKRES